VEGKILTQIRLSAFVGLFGTPIKLSSSFTFAHFKLLLSSNNFCFTIQVIRAGYYIPAGLRGQ